MKKLKITIGQQVVYAKLMTENAPNLTKKMEEYSPIEGRLNHAKVCDNEVFVQAPFFQDEKENPIFPVPGDIGYFPVRQTICLWFGPMKPLGPSTVLAKIYPEDLPRFAAEATKVWANQGTMIKLEVVEG